MASEQEAQQLDSEGATIDEVASTWLDEIRLSEKYFEDYWSRVQRIVKRLRDERSQDRRTAKFNILWSNLQTLQPAVYARPPKAQVERRFKDQDVLGRDAAQILERALQFSISAQDFDTLMRNVRDDYLVAGRGQAWVRYVPHGGERVQTDTLPDGEYEDIENEEVIADYLLWSDFLHSPARQWSEVRWVARKTYLTKEEVKERFPKYANDVPYNVIPSNVEEKNSYDEDRRDQQKGKFYKCLVYEIWSKPDNKVFWIAKDFRGGVLDEMDPPLKLRNFFPCPRPLYATLTTDSLIPIPDFMMYQDQAREMDEITGRISLLTKALALKGVYDASFDALKRLVNNTTENTLIPVENWPAFQTTGGFDGVLQWMPIEEMAKVLLQLYDMRDRLKNDIYEISGISDVIRGFSKASETATATQTKSQFATLRIQDRQQQLQIFARDLIAIMAEVICENFEPETIAGMCGVQTADPEIQQNYQAALQLLKNDQLRTFRVDIETDSLLAVDQTTEKQSRTEFITAVGQFMQTAGAVQQTMPDIMPMMGEFLLWFARGFRVSRPLEQAIEKSVEDAIQQAQQRQQQPPPPDPNVMKVQGELQIEQQRMQMEQQSQQQDMQFKQASAAQDAQLQQQKMALEAEKMNKQLQMDMQKMQVELALQAEQIRMEMALKAQELQGTMEMKSKELQMKQPPKVKKTGKIGDRSFEITEEPVFDEQTQSGL